jgi:hypothetical protein
MQDFAGPSTVVIPNIPGFDEDRTSSSLWPEGVSTIRDLSIKV